MTDGNMRIANELVVHHKALFLNLLHSFHFHSALTRKMTREVQYNTAKQSTCEDDLQMTSDSHKNNILVTGGI